VRWWNLTVSPLHEGPFLDPTFKGLYQANAFDMLLLVPYFIVLVLLAIYGMHRYQLVYLYYKHRRTRSPSPNRILPSCRASPSSCHLQ